MTNAHIGRRTPAKMAMIAVLPLCLLAACGEKAPQGADSVTVDTQTPPMTDGTTDPMAPTTMPDSSADGSLMGTGSMAGGTAAPGTVEPNTTDSVTTPTAPNAADAGTAPAMGTGTGNTNTAGDPPR